MDVNQIFAFLGGTDASITQPGMYPGVAGKDAVCNMIVDSNFDLAYDLLTPKITDTDLINLILTFSVDTLNNDQLIKLGLSNYSGIHLDELPPFLREFSMNEFGYFEMAEPTEALDTLERAIKYFGDDLNNLKTKELPKWAQAREDALEMRAILIQLKRK
jgi:hypothetical protein